MKQTHLLSKLSPPSYSLSFDRRRLFAKVDRSLEQPVTWISGPAGAGKTTLVLSYLKHKGISPLWFQVDESDSDLASFFYHLSLLAQQHAPEQNALAQLTPEYLHGIPVFARNFARDFYNRLPSGSVLIFDNFQDAGADNPLDSLLPVILADIPSTVRVVILSRSIPPDNLTPMLTSGEVQTLNWQHLQFTEEEIEGLIKLRNTTQPFSKTEIANLHQTTQGWAASLVLMLERPFDKALPMISEGRSKETIFESYANELFKLASDEVKSFLLKTAVLQNIDIDVAEKLTENMNSKNILDDMAQRNYFTIKRFGSSANFQYHPLFREFLLTQAMHKLGKEQLAEIQIQAADILLNQGDVTHAAGLLRQAQDWDKLLALILKHAQSTLEKGHFSTLRHWITSLPKKMQTHNSWLHYWQGMIEITINPISAISYFQNAYRLTQQQNDPLAQVLSWCGAINAYAYSWGEVKTLDNWIADLEPILAITQKIADPAIQEQVDYAAYLALMYRQPRHIKMKEYEEKVWDIVLHGDNFQTRIQAASQLLFYLTWWSGDFDKAEILVQTMQPIMEHPAAPPLVKLTWHSMLSSYYGSIFKAEECEENILMGIALSDETGIYIWKPWLYLKGCFLNLQKGDTKESAYYLEHLHKAMRPEDLLNQAIYYHFQAWYHLHENNINGVRENVLIARKLAGDAGNAIVEIFIDAGYAKYLFLTGETASALNLVHAIRKKSMDIGSKTMAFLSYVPEADHYLASGDQQNCLKVLPDLFNITKTYSAIWWRDQEFSRFCALALENNIAEEYVKEIIARHKLRPPVDFNNDTWPFPVKIYTLGQFRIVINNETVKSSGKVQKKPLELIKTLIALGGRDVRDDLIAEALWPDAESDSAYDCLRTTVKRVRKLLNVKEVIGFSEGKLSFNPEYCWVDAWTFEHMLSTTDPADMQIEKALNLYHGNFLDNEPDNYPILSTRERLRQKFTDTIRQLGLNHENECRWQQAIDVYQQGLEVDDLVEIFYQGLMHCYYQLGLATELEKVYQHCYQLFENKLGIAPSSETNNLYQQSMASLAK